MPANRLQLQNALHKPYERLLFAKEILSPIFGNSFKLNTIDVKAPILPNKTEAAFIDKVSVYGYINLEDTTEIICYEIVLQETVRLEISKVAIQQYVRKLLTAGQAALVNFIAPINKNVWRLTLVAKDSILTDTGVKEKTTNSKRYTYLLGPGESCRTAAERFEVLSTEKRLDFDKLIKAFSVEKLSKAFFDEYTLHYSNFVNYLSIDTSYIKSSFNGNDKLVRDFAKKLLGRIVFLYFVQKKGWLGASSKAYNDGNTSFIFSLFLKSGGNETFYPNWLSILFFETLNQNEEQNKNRKDDNFKLPDGTIVKIPFLNGGLFDKDVHDENILTFKPLLFHNPDNEDDPKHRGFLDFLNAFNFTVFEDSPDDHTVAVDPEMLGHIFENLLEDNKDKGAFYTPKEIVHYMCQESLTEYLTTQLGKEFSIYQQIDKDNVQILSDDNSKKRITPIEKLDNNSFNKDDITFLINHKNRRELTVQQLNQIDELLDKIKICDPAIGSGAFPMGLLQEIFAIKELVAYETNKIWKPANVKEKIIQESIYGVDIEKGAVDIARLRFWLSLVVDEEKPRPLPNLDYKIVVGNSLVSKFDDEVIGIDWNIKSKAVSAVENIIIDQQEKINLLQYKQSTYFTAVGNKDKLKKEIELLKAKVLLNQLALTKISFEQSNPKLGGFSPLAKEIIKNQENHLTLTGYSKIIKKLEEFKGEKSLNFFEWKLNFPEVLNEKINQNVGFDIVIGNPPYLNFKMYSSQDREVLKRIYPSIFDGKADIYYYFFVCAADLAKSDGYVSFITSRYWLEAEFASKLRKYIVDNTTLLEIIDFKNVTVFDGVGIKTAVTSFKSKASTAYSFFYRDHPGKKIDKINLSEFKSIEIPKVNIDKSSWVLKDYNGSSLIQKIEDNSIPLSDITHCKQGILTGFDKAFIIPNNLELNLPEKYLKPWLKVGDVFKYYFEIREERNLIYPPNIKNINEYPLLLNHLNNFKEKLENRGEAKAGNYRWFDLHRPRNSELFDSPKLICRYKASQNTFALDENFYYSSADTTIVVLKKEYYKDYSLKYILALLNSKLLDYYFKSYGKLMDYRYEYYPGPVGRMRIKNSPYQNLFANLVEYIIYLRSRKLNSATEHLMPLYFEQIIDGMVYELYLVDLLVKHKREIIKYLGNIPEISNSYNDEVNMDVIKSVFNRLNQKEHPIRINLFFMNTIPEISIIEGKL